MTSMTASVLVRSCFEHALHRDETGFHEKNCFSQVINNNPDSLWDAKGLAVHREVHCDQMVFVARQTLVTVVIDMQTVFDALAGVAIRATA